MVERVRNLVIGSGAAGLAAAVRLRAMGEEVLLCTEGLASGTSVNAGSDKQTYYKLAIDGAAPDSPIEMAADLAGGGAMHGDIALVEAALSPIAFSFLVALGVDFPHDAFGRYVGYRTDHDSRARATSVGPYTSRDMCRALAREARRAGVTVREGLVAVKLLVRGGTAIGAVFAALDGPAPRLSAVLAENIVFATGGPGGLYGRSVYPESQTGGIGLALLEGAAARNLCEGQFGLASTAFRWNVSGSYMQAIPRLYSVGPDGVRHNFLADFPGGPGAARGAVFLKGYQWPFAVARASGSSLIDILVFIETVLRGRRVYLDYRDPDGGLSPDLPGEARAYLLKCGATADTPFARLMAINAPAVALYREHGIDLEKEPLEVAVCAQHCNGGLAGDIWWQSTNVPHLFPVGEVNGSHGVTRPGGSALNAGQVGAWRAAEYIARLAPRNDAATGPGAEAFAREALKKIGDGLSRPPAQDWRDIRRRIQSRMDAVCGFARSAEALASASFDARADLTASAAPGLAGLDARGAAEALRTHALAAASYVYIKAAEAQVVRSGSRGGVLALGPAGDLVSPGLGEAWRALPERPEARGECALARMDADGEVAISYEPCRPVPPDVGWFETVWKEHRERNRR